jgi:hypothetical protein
MILIKVSIKWDIVVEICDHFESFWSDESKTTINMTFWSSLFSSPTIFFVQFSSRGFLGYSKKYYFRMIISCELFCKPHQFWKNTNVICSITRIINHNSLICTQKTLSSIFLFTTLYISWTIYFINVDWPMQPWNFILVNGLFF